MEVRVARIFNTYGPRMHMNDGRVVSNFILQALQNDVITVSRAFCPHFICMSMEIDISQSFDNNMWCSKSAY